jgi:hypothetical protein
LAWAAGWGPGDCGLEGRVLPAGSWVEDAAGGLAALFPWAALG